MAGAESIAQFAAQGPTVLLTWSPEDDHYSAPTPVIFVRAEGNVLAWWACFSTGPIAARVRNTIVKPDGSIRADLDMLPDMSLIFRRPANEAEYNRGATWVAEHRSQLGNAEGTLYGAIRTMRNEGAPKKRDKLIPVSYWSAFNFGIHRTVPAGIVVPNEAQRTLTWVPLPGWESAADERNQNIGFSIDNPLAIMQELAERPTQNMSLSYPEYIRAASVEDAVDIGISTQQRNLVATLSSERNQ